MKKGKGLSGELSFIVRYKFITIQLNLNKRARYLVVPINVKMPWFAGRFSPLFVTSSKVFFWGTLCQIIQVKSSKANDPPDSHLFWDKEKESADVAAYEKWYVLSMILLKAKYI